MLEVQFCTLITEDKLTTKGDEMKRFLRPWVLAVCLATIATSFSLLMGSGIAKAQTIQIQQGTATWGEVVEVKIDWSGVSITDGVTPTVRIGSMGKILPQEGCKYLTKGTTDVRCNPLAGSVFIEAGPSSRIMDIGLMLGKSPVPVQYFSLPVMASGIVMSYTPTSGVALPVPLDNCVPQYDYSWDCALMAGNSPTMRLYVPFDLTTVWGILLNRLPSQKNFRLQASRKFDAAIVDRAGFLTPVVCNVINNVWDVTCDLAGFGLFQIDFLMPKPLPLTPDATPEATPAPKQ